MTATVTKLPVAGELLCNPFGERRHSEIADALLSLDVNGLLPRKTKLLFSNDLLPLVLSFGFVPKLKN